MFKSVFIIPLLAFSFTFVNPCSHEGQRPVQQPTEDEKVFQVEVTYPKFLSVPRSHNVQGKLMQSEIDHVTANFGGDVQEVFVSVGDVVEKGDPVVTLSSKDLLDKIDVHTAKLTELGARLEEAKNKVSGLNRPDRPVTNDEVLFLDEEPVTEPEAKKNFGYPEDKPPQTLKDLVDVLDAMIERYNAELDVLNKRLMEQTQKSPVSGIVFETHVSEGNKVRAQDKLVTIAQTDPLSVSFHVPKEVASFVDKRSKVSVFALDAPDAIGEGLVYYIAPDVDPVQNTIEVRAYVSNPDQRLKGNQQVHVHLTTQKMDRVLALPKQAIVHENGRSYLFVVYGNQSRLIEVKTGRELENGLIAVHGVEVRVDDPIVLNRPLDLKNNSFVEIVKTKVEPEVQDDQNTGENMEMEKGAEEEVL